MKPEEKELLLKDLCARLPYGVICDIYNDTCTIKEKLLFGGIVRFADDTICLRPYLRPLSSMSEEERNDFIKCAGYEVIESENGRHYDYYLKDFCGTEDAPCANADAIDWLNARYFDYRNLIERGLAIAVTEENNPYK